MSVLESKVNELSEKNKVYESSSYVMRTPPCGREVKDSPNTNEELTTTLSNLKWGFRTREQSLVSDKEKCYKSLKRLFGVQESSVDAVR